MHVFTVLACIYSLSIIIVSNRYNEISLHPKFSNFDQFSNCPAEYNAAANCKAQTSLK